MKHTLEELDGLFISKPSPMINLLCILSMILEKCEGQFCYSQMAELLGIAEKCDALQEVVEKCIYEMERMVGERIDEEAERIAIDWLLKKKEIDWETDREMEKYHKDMQ